MKGIFNVMTYKQMIAELASTEEFSVERLKALEAYKELEQHPEIIKAIESYHLPEINRLICTSDLLLKESWAKYYKKISDIVRYEDNSNSINSKSNKLKQEKAINKLLIEMNKAGDDGESEFKQLINLEDNIFKIRLAESFHNISNEIQIAKKEVDKIKKEQEKRAEIKKRKESEIRSYCNEYDELSDKDLDEKIDELLDDINYKSDWMKDYERFAEIISHNNNPDFEERRSKVYAITKTFSEPDADEFVELFIRENVISEEYIQSLRKPEFLSKVISCLNRMQKYACQVILCLVNEGYIDLNSKEFKECINNIESKYLHGYLFEEYKERKSIINDKTVLKLWNIAILKEIQNEHKEPIFTDLWAIIDDKKSWNYIIKSVAMCSDFYKNIIKFISVDNPRSPSIIAELIVSSDDIKIRSSVTEIASEILGNDKQNRIVRELLYEMNSINSKNITQLNIANRKNLRYGQDLFSSIYKPVEQLEGFTIDLKMSTKNFSKNIIINELMDIVEKLRDGLLDLDIDTVEELDNWKNQISVKYNLKKHMLESMSEIKPSEVKIHALGYKYKDSDGKKQCYRAKVYVSDDFIEVNNKKQSVKDSIKNKPYKKKNITPKRTTVSKNKNKLLEE